MRKLRILSALMVLLVFAACDKKEPGNGSGNPAPLVLTPVVDPPADCSDMLVAERPVRVGETEMFLPAGTRFCPSDDELKMRVELPENFSFYSPELASKTLPYYESTYACYCSREGSPCKVFYAAGLGFGCLQSSCAGSCTGKFTYMGYSIDKVFHTGDKMEFFKDEDVQEIIRTDYLAGFNMVSKNVKPENLVYVEQELMGVPFYVLQEKEALPESFLQAKVLPYEDALCECGGTKACTLKTLTLGNPGIDIFFCEGRCNGCELTVD